MICASCGTQNDPDSRFCDNCAAALSAACQACGQPNRPEARFCRNCAEPLGTDAPTATLAQAQAQAQPTAGTERRLVSVLFTDLVGFTRLAEDRDPEAVRDLLNRYFASATEIIGLHGGSVEKFIGDAVMAVWGTPVAHEDDAERGVRAALELVAAIGTLHPDLQARAAVLTGEAAVTVGAQNQGMVAGDLVNTAARLQGVAEPGTVLVGESTKRAAERAIVFEEVGEHSLKGKTAPVPAWRALRVVAARGGQGRADALEPPFVGRDEELRQLKEHLHAVGREQRVRLLSITGPAGIGKSRLVWELEKYVDGVAEPIWWHRGRSPSYGEGIAFWALGEMVRRRAGLAEDDDAATTRERLAASVQEFLPDPVERELVERALLALLGVEPAPPGGRDALFPAWRLFFERIAAGGTIVLVFEDLQWADTGLLDFIDHLVDWSRGLPIMVVTLARPELFDRRPDWGAARRNFVAMALDPLPAEAMRRLLDGLVPGLPEAALSPIIERADGVPLYAVETVRSLLAEGRIEREGEVYRPVGDLTTLTVPESLRSLVASRLDTVEAEDRSLLQTASVVGQVFTASTLAAVVGVEQAELESRLRGLVRRELLEIESDPASPERGQYGFVQSVIREVAYGTLGRRDRRARHLAVARHFEAVGDEELAGALASHYLAAHEASDEGPEAEAVATQARLALSAAADRAAALGGHDQAVAYLERALAITREAADRAPLLDRAAASAIAASRDAEPFAVEAIEAHRALGDPAAAAAATARYGKALIDAGEIKRATDVLEAALPEAESIGDEYVLALTLAHLARAHMRSARSARAVEVADRALDIAERLDLEPVIAEALVNKGAALNMKGRRREAAALEEAALALAQRIGDLILEMRIRNNLAAAYADDEPARATRMQLETRDLAREIGDRSMYNWVAGMAAIGTLSEGGDIDAHIAVLNEALESATLRVDRLRLRILRGALELARGENVDELRQEVSELVGDGTDPEVTLVLHLANGSAALIAADLDSAFEEAMAAWAVGPQNPEVPLSLALAAAAWARNVERARLAEQRMAEAPGSGAMWRALRLSASAVVAALEGRSAAALAAFREARDIALRLEQRFDAAQMVIHAAHVLPDEPEVSAWAAEARPLLERLRARPYLERLDTALAASRRVPPAAVGDEAAVSGTTA